MKGKTVADSSLEFRLLIAHFHNVCIYFLLLVSLDNLLLIKTFIFV